MEVHHPITPIAQAHDIKPYFWKRRSCGIASLCMIMNSYTQRIHKGTLQTLIDRGVVIHAYLAGIGWTHQGLIDLAKEYGFIGERFDYAKNDPQEGFDVLLNNVKKGPVIVSIHKDFNIKNGGHLVVVNGYTKTPTEIILHIVDPKSKRIKYAIRTVPQKKFVAGWKKRFIVIRPNNIT
ncbi:MAG: hypothetical protein ACD_81C00188G0016 [uncultured bacterium]|uniref:Peptidase C39-like domain-containing protein n=2 Tax=Candidatus Wolfeibacteriota TaxID=1752735 RepID=A0A0G1JII1_9BACT|nr:MAG: hypothetical protein ACD_81C00188G0016 [uncultured bacterium]KKR12859.1 MAG: hypothetical protein UT41_C0001G0403 [Candidatus Wolfebacteria bacterium GW2011_GWC2_39_22]KKT43792.1 MAG: hypothetical protein UW32_C0001G0384 [Candidatus Wolfebacteria bacterium GW2011_GWE2_44_13]HBI25480.1 hypothetical protein [Candidatus Wolfebacteria bacterium]